MLATKTHLLSAASPLMLQLEVMAAQSGRDSAAGRTGAAARAAQLGLLFVNVSLDADGRRTILTAVRGCGASCNIVAAAVWTARS
jgi:hypothetical protein